MFTASNENTQVHGSLSARGAGFGSGGFIETSGHSLDVTGIKIILSTQGPAGTWLLDPTTIYIATNKPMPQRLG